MDKKVDKKMLGIFPNSFSQEANSQGYFPKWQPPKSILSSANFPNLKFTKWQLSKSVLAAALGSLAYPSWSTRPNCCLQRLWRPNLTFGKLPLGKLDIWEVATWKIVTWEAAHVTMPLGKYLTPTKLLEVKTKNFALIKS